MTSERVERNRPLSEADIDDMGSDTSTHGPTKKEWHGMTVSRGFPTGQFLFDAITNSDTRASLTSLPNTTRTTEMSPIKKLKDDIKANNIQLIEKIGVSRVLGAYFEHQRELEREGRAPRVIYVGGRYPSPVKPSDQDMSSPFMDWPYSFPPTSSDHEY